MFFLSQIRQLRSLQNRFVWTDIERFKSFDLTIYLRFYRALIRKIVQRQLSVILNCWISNGVICKPLWNRSTKRNNSIITIPFTCRWLQLTLFTRLIDCKVLLNFNDKQLRLQQHAGTWGARQPWLDRLCQIKKLSLSNHCYLWHVITFSIYSWGQRSSKSVSLLCTSARR